MIQLKIVDLAFNNTHSYLCITWPEVKPFFLCLQVISGGQYDVDMDLTAPNGQVLYKDVRKQYDSFTWTPDQTGVFKFCFSNEFSTFTHKIVYFDFQVGDEKPLIDRGDDKHATAMTMVSFQIILYMSKCYQLFMCSETSFKPESILCKSIIKLSPCRQ